jgi:tripartite-type tricarboxylate transporter receptor subunit TctC
MYKNMDFDPLKSFAPVANIVWGSWVTVVPPELPVRDAKEFIAYAKAHPNTLNFGYGQGTAPQLVGEWFHKTNGLAIASVPYKGGMQAITDMMTGAIQVNIGTTATLLPLIQQGRVRALAVTSAERSAAAPDVPTIAEAGVKDCEISEWNGLLAPAGTPPAVIARLHEEMAKIMRMPDIREKFADLGATPIGSTPQELAAFIRAEMTKWAEVVKAANIKIE